MVVPINIDTTAKGLQSPQVRVDVQSGLSKSKVTVATYQSGSKLASTLALNRSAVHLQPGGSPNLMSKKSRDPFDIDKAFEELDTIKSKIGITTAGRTATLRNKNMQSATNLNMNLQIVEPEKPQGIIF